MRGQAAAHRGGAVASNQATAVACNRCLRPCRQRGPKLPQKPFPHPCTLGATRELSSLSAVDASLLAGGTYRCLRFASTRARSTPRLRFAFTEFHGRQVLLWVHPVQVAGSHPQVPFATATGHGAARRPTLVTSTRGVFPCVCQGPRRKNPARDSGAAALFFSFSKFRDRSSPSHGFTQGVAPRARVARNLRGFALSGRGKLPSHWLILKHGGGSWRVR